MFSLCLCVGRSLYTHTHTQKRARASVWAALFSLPPVHQFGLRPKLGNSDETHSLLPRTETTFPKKTLRLGKNPNQSLLANRNRNETTTTIEIVLWPHARANKRSTQKWLRAAYRTECVCVCVARCQFDKTSRAQYILTHSRGLGAPRRVSW